ncbi:MAG TPA: tetratricopeptide repeat protein [Chloroflexia bacterium]|nr:tetratricopeptide repeat protein [Chloroflexia bacterium]
MPTAAPLADSRTFGAWLRAARQARQWERAAFATRAGCSLIMLDKLEAGARHPSPRLAYALARALALTPADGEALAEWARAQPGAAWPPVPELVGRAAETARAVITLRDSGTRLLTLTGPGGVGKTRLATHLQGLLRTEMPAEIRFVALGALTEAMPLLGTIATECGLPDSPDPPLLRLAAAFTRSRGLLILDNYEQLLPDTDDVAALLAACPPLMVLVTSREALHLPGEVVLPVPPLALPPATTDLPALAASPAVVVFCARAVASQPEFALTAENAAAVGAICRRLEGLPLALELAAARVRLLPPAALLARLDQRLPLLASADPTRPARHQTLRAAIAWSYDLLAPPDQRTLRALSRFPGGATVPALAAVLDHPPAAAATSLDTLADKSLVQWTGARARLLETIREFAHAQRDAELPALARRQAACYLDWAAQADAAQSTAAEAGWRERLLAEGENLRAVLSWLAAHDPATGLQLAAYLGAFWDQVCTWTEGRAWLTQLLALAPAPSSPRIHALYWAGALARNQNDYATARACFEEGLALGAAVGDYTRQGALLNGLGNIADDQNDPAQAIEYYEAGLTIRRAENNSMGIGIILNNLGLAYLNQGDLARARTLYEESLAIWRALGNTRSAAVLLSNLAEVLCLRADWPAAAAIYTEALALLEHTQNPKELVHVYQGLGLVTLQQGQWEHAHTYYRQALTCCTALDSPRYTAAVLAGYVLLWARHPTAAPARAITRARVVAETLAAHAIELDRVDREAFDDALAALRRRVAPADWTRAWTAGSTLSLAEALAEALAATPEDAVPVESPPATPATGETLTPAEQAILQHLAQGATNAQIATALGISVTTVRFHLRNLYSKLDVRSRSAATRYALAAGLVRPT